VPPKKKEVTVPQIAHAAGFSPELVLAVLKEKPGHKVSREIQDKIFTTARRLGYDFRKLKIGKRMQTRKETLDEVLEKISDHPEWTRADIVKYLKESQALVLRVHKRVFKEEFGLEAP
jgi:DNA-binding LacI/PurR family transcriptional regulator